MRIIRGSSPRGHYYLAWATIALILGISAGLTLPATFNFSLLLWIFFGVSIGIFLPLFFLIRRKKNHYYYLADTILGWFLFLTFLLGIFRVYAFDNLQHRALKDSAGTAHTYTAMVTGKPTLSSTGKSYGFPVRILSYQTETETHNVSGSIMLYAPEEYSKKLHRGNTISFTATLSSPTEEPYTGGFSSRDFLYRQNYLFQQYVPSLSLVHEAFPAQCFDRIKFLGESIQDSILHAIDQSFGETSEESALLKGILLGVEEDFTPEQYQNFIDSGLIHITSVSGMHVFFLFSFLLALFRLLHLPRKLLYPILLPILFLFSAVAAFTPSVCRSTIMMLFFVLAQFLQREPDTLTSLSASAMILLLLNPYNLTSYSFLLSFSSTLGLVLFSGTIQYYLTKPFRPKNPEEKPAAKEKPFWRERLVDPVISSLSMSAGCLLGTGFFTMRFFRRITWGSFLPNLFLLPLSAPTFVLGLINWPIYYLCPFLANIISKLPLKLMLRCINLIASLFSHPIFRFETPTPPASAIFPYIFFCTALYYTLRGSFKNNT